MEQNENGQPLHEFIIDNYSSEHAAPYSWADTAREISEVVWDWQDWIARGFLHMIAGTSGIGHSATALRIVTSYITGCDWPDGTPYQGDTGYVLWCDSEAGQAINIQRAKAWGIPLNKIIIHADPVADFDFTNDNHWNAVEDICHDDRIKFAVFDSLSGMHESEESRALMARILKQFAILARDSNKPLMLAHHARKLLENKANVMTLARVRGSSTIIQYCRVVMALDAPNEDDTGHRRLQVVKSNMAEKPEPLGFYLVEPEATLEFTDRVPTESTKKLGKWKEDKAVEWMQAEVEAGSKLGPALDQRAMVAVPCSESTARRARQRIIAEEQ